MELSDASRRLIEWELRSNMQEHKCNCCDQEAGLHGQDPSTTTLQQIAHRILRLTQIHAFGFLLVIFGMAFLVTVLLGGQIHVPINQAITAKNDLLVSETPEQTQHPSAFLTAPKGSANDGTHLEWETMLGIAHLQGFRYSGGNLTVLREGYYSINLQITLMNNKDTCLKYTSESDTTNRLHMTVFRFTEEYPEFKRLIVTHDTMCCSEGCKKSLSTSGVFLLNAGTILRVEVHHSEHIKRRQNENEVFFGIHLQS